MKLVQKTGYASLEAGLFAVEFIIRIELLKFFSDSLKIPAYLVGLAIGIGLLWDAVSDPIMGFVSDYTQTRMGNRRPYMLAGGFLLAICFVALFQANANWSIPLKFSYLVAVYLLVNTALTMVSVPHAALSGEISGNALERTKIIGLRLFFGNLGLLLALFFTSTMPLSEASFYMALMIIFFTMVSVVSVRSVPSRPIEHREPLNKAIFTFLKTVGHSLRNPYFKPLFWAYFVASLGIAMNSSLARYYYEDFLNLNREQTGIVLAVFLVFWTIGLIGWVQVSKKWGKKKPAFWGILLLAIMTIVGYPLFPAGELLGPVAAAIVGGILVGCVVLLESLVPDIVDVDEKETGEHREGLYFGMWKMATKLSRAFGLVVTGFLLSLIGYDETATQQTNIISYRLALLFGPGVGFFFLLGAIIFRFADKPKSAKGSVS